VLTSVRVDAFVSHPESFDRLSAYDVGIDDLIYVIKSDMPIPDRLRIYDEVRTVLALIETP
jgi:hypothetical protein